MYYRYKDLHQAVKSKRSGENKKAKVLWALKEAKDGGVDFYDASHEKEIKTRDKVRLDLWAIHLKNRRPPWQKPFKVLNKVRVNGEPEVLAPLPLPLVV